MSQYQGPYAGPPAPQSGGQPPYSGTAAPHPDPAAPYPSQHANAGQMPPYPGQPASYPGPQFSGPAAPYPGSPAPYPGAQAYPGGPGAYPIVQSGPKYRSLRRAAQVSIGLMALTSVAAVIQSIALWSSYAGVKRFVYGLVSEDEFQRGAERIAHTGPLLDLANYLFLGTGIAFVIWLWQARENTEVLKPGFAASYEGGYNSHSGAHRHAQGWIIGSWICPVVQFWYPLQVVQDVVTASEPADEPGVAGSGQIRSLLIGWWASWVGFWVILVGGGGFAGVSFIVWLVRLVDRADAAEATGDYVDIYDLQTFMVRVALGVDIGFTVATVLLIVAAITSSFLMLRVTTWQQSQAAALTPIPNGPVQDRPGAGGLPQPGAGGRSGLGAGGRLQPGAGGLPQPGVGGLPQPGAGGYPHPGPQAGSPGYPPAEPPQYAPRPLPGFTTQQPPKPFPSYGTPQQQQPGTQDPRPT